MTVEWHVLATASTAAVIGDRCAQWVTKESYQVRRMQLDLADANRLGTVAHGGSLRGRDDSTLRGSPRVATRFQGTHVRACSATQRKGATTAVTI